MRDVHVDVVLARETSAARVACATAGGLDEPGLAIRVFAARGDGAGLDPIASSPGAGGELGAEYVAVFARDVVPLPGAIARMLATATAATGVGLVLGAAVPVGGDAGRARETMGQHTARHHRRAARFPDRSFVTVYGASEVAAVLCRRAALPAGPIGSRLAAGPEYVLELLSRVPCRVAADPVGVRLREEAPRSASDRLTAALRRLRAPSARAGARVAGAALATALGLEGARTRLRESRARVWQEVAWRTLRPVAEAVHDFCLTRFAEWPIGRTADGGTGPSSPPRIAYYLWRFPVLSETFIRRELGALGEAGVDVGVLADGSGGGASEDPELAPWVRRTAYVLPVAPRTLVRDLTGALLRRPFRTLNLFAYTCFRPYHVPKSLTQDVRVFLKAVRVAALLRRGGITHLHSPWGDTDAFVGMMAARLAGAGFSVQFRAQDLHRRTLAFQVREKVRNARFVVTNTQFNLAHLRGLTDPRDHDKIVQIYNGLELGRLDPSGRRRARSGGPVRILSVARLIEPKGLPDLFAACRILRDRGHDVRCTVIGGPELPRYVNDLIEIRRARRRLDLEDTVDLAGAQPFARVIAAYADADVFALPCVVGADASNDIIPNAILEAMAMEVPVVATGITAIPELVDDGVSGLLVAPHDPHGLADAIERLIADPAFAAAIAANARTRVTERFDVARNVRAYAALFGVR